MPDLINYSEFKCCEITLGGKHETWCPFSGDYHWLTTARFVESLRAQLAKSGVQIERLQRELM